jgi:hypothetical protein
MPKPQSTFAVSRFDSARQLMGYCVEGTTSTAQALYDADECGQGSEEGHDGGRTRTARLHLGHRNQD